MASPRLTPEQASSPRSDLIRFSTDAMPERQRFDYWAEALSETLFGMSTKTLARKTFNCRLTATHLDSLQLARVSGSNQESFRTRRYIAQSSGQAYHLVADFSRSWVATRQGEQILMQPGDLILLDTEELHGGAWKDGCLVSNLILPPLWLRTWVSQPDGLVGRRIERGNGWGKQLSLFISKLTPGLVASTSLPLRGLVDHMGALLSLLETEMAATSQTGRTSTAIAKENMAAITELMRERLREQDLDAQAVANSLGIPVDALHRWMSASGTTFGRHLQQQRALAASNMLTARIFDSLPPSEIGARVGVHSATQFARLLRRHLGESPLAHRQASLDD